MKRWEQKQIGFTIVELLIVIVVIAILAAITIVAYTGIQASATDARIRTAVSQVEKAAYTWSIKHGQAPSSGGYASTSKNADGTCTGGTGGWVRSGQYVCSLEDMLLADNLIPAGFIAGLPPNKIYGNTSVQTLMFYPCGGASAKTYALYYYLGNPSAEDTANVSAAEAAGCSTSPRINYGMRGARLLGF